jgi:glutathione synthase/RimK-type ligase-like ATP-grasp enzyme
MGITRLISNGVKCLKYKFDAHADMIIPRIEEMGGEVVRLNLAQAPGNSETHFLIGKDGYDFDYKILSSSKTFAKNVTSIWWRKPSAFSVAEVPENEMRFVQMEHTAYFRGLWALLNPYWMSHPEAIRNADHKIEQLIRASNLGFSIPRTLVTNNMTLVEDFLTENKNGTIYKVLTDPALGIFTSEEPVDGDTVDIVRTTLLTDEDKEYLHTVSIAPCLFQEHVIKKRDIRVTVIHDKVFALGIESQHSEETKIDWRTQKMEVETEAIDLPHELQHKCIEYVKSYNLNFGAIDFIENEEGEYIFLENNPVGQFLFCEILQPKLEMSSYLADILVNPPNL